MTPTRRLQVFAVEPDAIQLSWAALGPGEFTARAMHESGDAAATIQGEFAPCPAVIRNISTRGMLIESRQPLRIGQDIEIRCGKMMPMSAQVRWVNGGQAGLLLLMPIALDEFEQRRAHEASRPKRLINSATVPKASATLAMPAASARPPPTSAPRTFWLAAIATTIGM